jgi:glycosyltransferase involved in cell wall biosynthesis
MSADDPHIICFRRQTSQNFNFMRSKVTAIIPVYNGAGYIRRAIESVLSQTQPADELIVVDDGSTDETAAIVWSFGPEVRYLYQPNSGVAAARNKGIKQATSEWIAFLDADDYWEPSKLASQLAFSEGVGLVGARWYTEYPGNPRCLAEIPNNAFFGRMFTACGSEAFQVAMNLWTGVVLVRRNLVCDQRFVSGLETAEDRDLWIRLAASTPVYLVPEPLATYVQYGNSQSNSDPARDCGNMLKVVRRHAELLGSKGVREQEANVYRRWAGIHLARGSPRSAVIPAAHRLAIQPTSPQAWWIMCKSLVRSTLL